MSSRAHPRTPAPKYSALGPRAARAVVARADVPAHPGASICSPQPSGTPRRFLLRSRDPQSQIARLKKIFFLEISA
ncbi:hypothetical protein EVAR_80913_1 [Eumeta japonica]|uniref:Uncharacterized protein n=1 Tax=Eumeta variegata TaxID=151549 RepID=A0A4C1V1G6_EUMVA|nr:hypothetical protein EVAR_80913_1 [Eumeta japonica]